MLIGWICMSVIGQQCRMCNGSLRLFLIFSGAPRVRKARAWT